MIDTAHCRYCDGIGRQMDMHGFTISNDQEQMMKQFKRMMEVPKCGVCRGTGYMKLVAMSDEEIKQWEEQKKSNKYTQRF